MASTAARAGKLVSNSAALFVCDVQDKFRPVISGMPAVIDTTRRMVRAANILGVPVVATEQYPERLGATVKEVSEVLTPQTPIVSKFQFSMCTSQVTDWLKAQENVRQVLLCGIEAHVCVLQTTLDLLEQGYEVHVLADGVSSQRPLDRAVGLHRMAQSGAFLVTSEMALFQIMKEAKHKDFKAISNLAKESRPESLPFLSAM